MNQTNYHKLGETLRSKGFDAALLSSPFNLTWLTGYAPAIQTGPSPFEGGPALGWFLDGELTLLLSEWEAPVAAALGAAVKPYTAYALDQPLSATGRQGLALAELLRPHANMKGKVGVEMNFLPAALLDPLQEALPQVEFQPIDHLIDPLRGVKTPEELALIRAALRLCDLAQEEVRLGSRPGVTELELWERVKGRVESEAGGRVPVLVDLVAGARTADVGGPPGPYSVQPDDPVMLDIVPRLDGYWGDNCAGYFAGEPAAELKKAYAVVLEALNRGRDAIRPGLKAGELDSLVRGVVQEAGYEPYPHHSGHGLGTSYHEEPRIVPGNPFRLEPDMVLVLEPGVYLPGTGGVRLEDAFLVTSDGCQTLTHHLEKLS